MFNSWKFMFKDFCGICVIRGQIILLDFGIDF